MSTRTNILTFLLIAAATAAAQSPVAISVQAPDRLPIQSSSFQSGKTLTIDVMVDGKGAPTTGLTQHDFVVRDNKAVQPITSFRPINGLSEVIIVIDAVNTDQRLLGQERQRVDDFLTAGGGKLAYPTTLAILQDKGVQIQEAPSRDGNALKASLDKTEIGLRVIRRSSGIYGADDELGISINALRNLLTREIPRPGHKIILFVSPGWPILSGPGIDLTSRQESQVFADVTGFYNLFRDSHTTIYSVDPIGAGENLEREDLYEAYLSGVDSPRMTALGDLSLQTLAIHSGGRVMNSNNDTALLLREAVRDSSEAYEVTYTPPPTQADDPKRPSQYHHIEIKLENSNLKARTIDGYYTHP